MTKILFLDLDGVVNSTRTMLAFGGYPRTLGPMDVAMFDPVSLALIRGMCKRAGVQIVLSSAWRGEYHWNDVGEALKLPIIAATPFCLGPRGKEIALWLAQHGANLPGGLECYAIIDDNPDMLEEQQDRFVHTDGHEGISFKDFAKLCALFGLNVHDTAPARVRAVNAQRLAWEDDL